jgi:hypothetical protein
MVFCLFLHPYNGQLVNFVCSQYTHLALACQERFVLIADAVLQCTTDLSEPPEYRGGYTDKVQPDTVEVLSPGLTNERRDREFKLRLYSRRGVSEYWIVNWQERRLEIYRREEAILCRTNQIERTRGAHERIRHCRIHTLLHPPDCLLQLIVQFLFPLLRQCNRHHLART